MDISKLRIYADSRVHKSNFAPTDTIADIGKLTHGNSGSHSFS